MAIPNLIYYLYILYDTFQSYGFERTVWVVFEIVKSYVKYDFGSGAGRSPSLAWASPVLWIAILPIPNVLVLGSFFSGHGFFFIFYDILKLQVARYSPTSHTVASLK